MATLDPTPALTDDDPLARFILFGHHYAATKNRVKPAAFAPDGTATSVFAIRSLSVGRGGEARGQAPATGVQAPPWRADSVAASAMRSAMSPSCPVGVTGFPPRTASTNAWSSAV